MAIDLQGIHPINLLRNLKKNQIDAVREETVIHLETVIDTIERCDKEYYSGYGK